ncbi:MAG: hypothetical protein V4850_17505 [Myxococcota bacterium]
MARDPDLTDVDLEQRLASLPPEALAEVDAAIVGGRGIDAIRLLRAALSLGLREANLAIHLRYTHLVRAGLLVPEPTEDERLRAFVSTFTGTALAVEAYRDEHYGLVALVLVVADEGGGSRERYLTGYSVREGYTRVAARAARLGTELAGMLHVPFRFRSPE